MADPTVFNPQIIHAQKLFAITLSPEKVRVSLESRHDIGVVDLREDPFFLGPDAGAVRPRGLADAGIEEVAPVLAVVGFQGGDIVLDVEQPAGSRAVHDLVEGVGLVGGLVRWVRVERDVLGGEEVGVRWVVAASLVADVFVEWAAGFGD